MTSVLLPLQPSILRCTIPKNSHSLAYAPLQCHMQRTPTRISAFEIAGDYHWTSIRDVKIAPFRTICTKNPAGLSCALLLLPLVCLYFNVTQTRLVIFGVFLRFAEADSTWTVAQPHRRL